jgi:thiamine-monophosphate kinase
VPQDTLEGLGEDALVCAILARYGPAPTGVRVGPGDDAAVLDVAGPVVVSTDTLVEGEDFRRAWSTGFDVGVKTAAQSFADVAAMGARPVALLVSLAAPGDLPGEWARGLADGLADECARAGAAVVGGDVSAAPLVVVTGTALGVLPGQAVLRSGARPGHVVALAGRTGPSGAGLALLAAGFHPGAAAGGGAGSGAGGTDLALLVAAHTAPRPDYPAGPVAAAAGASALIDTSDGLLRDAARVAAAAGVVLDLDPAALAPAADLVGAAEHLGAPDPQGRATEWVLAGGEDHALLACFPAHAALPAPFRAVGQVLGLPAGASAAPAAPGTAPGVLVGGRPWAGPTGWQHFARPPALD